MRHGLVGLVLLGVLLAGCLNGGVREPGPVAPSEREMLLQGIHGPGTSLVRIVVHAHPDRSPLDTTVEAVVEQFGLLTGKPVELEVRLEPSPFPEDHVWSHADRRPQEDAALAEPWPEGVALVHLFSMPGCLAYNETRTCIGGVAGRVAWVFTDATNGDALGDQAQNPLLRDAPRVGWYREERFLYVHELAHVAGLVGDIPQVRDRLHPEDCHCHGTQDDSVMYRFRQGFRVPADPGEVVETFERDNFDLYTFNQADLDDAAAYRAALR